MRVFLIATKGGGWVTVSSFATEDEAIEKATELLALTKDLLVYGPVESDTPVLTLEDLPATAVAAQGEYELGESLLSVPFTPKPVN